MSTNLYLQLLGKFWDPQVCIFLQTLWTRTSDTEIWQVQPSTSTSILFNMSIPARSTDIWRTLRSLQSAGCNSGGSFRHVTQEPASTASPLERNFLPFELVILHIYQKDLLAQYYQVPVRAKSPKTIGKWRLQRLGRKLTKMNWDSHAFVGQTSTLFCKWKRLVSGRSLENIS